MRTCNPYTWSALSPIKATEDMTHPVGQRDGQLFTRPTGGVPEYSSAVNGYVLQVVNGELVWTPALSNATADILVLKGNISILESQMDEIIDGLVRLSAIQADILGGVV